MTSQYILYGSPDSANLVIRMLLHELDQPFETVWVDRSKRDHKKPEFLQMNPQGLLPVLVDNNESIFETAAIVLHLCESHGAMMPQAIPSRAHFLQWLFYLSNTLHADLRVRFYTHSYIDGEAQQQALLAGIQRRFQGHLQLIERELGTQGSGHWFLGDSLSALDIYFAALCRWWQLYPAANPGALITSERLPRVYHLLSNLAQRPAVMTACAEEHITSSFFIDPNMPDLPAESIIG